MPHKIAQILVSHVCKVDNLAMPAGPEVAFEAFSVLDGFGRPSAPLHASKTLVASILAALDGSKPIARARKDASDEQLGFALQVAFTEALPKVSDVLFTLSEGACGAGTALTNMQRLCMASSEDIICMCSWPSIR